jgi:aspartate racemase
VVAACTELPLAYQASGLDPGGMVSSLESLAEACLERIYHTG